MRKTSWVALNTVTLGPLASLVGALILTVVATLQLPLFGVTPDGPIRAPNPFDTLGFFIGGLLPAVPSALSYAAILSMSPRIRQRRIERICLAGAIGWLFCLTVLVIPLSDPSYSFLGNGEAALIGAVAGACIAYRAP